MQELDNGARADCWAQLAGALAEHAGDNNTPDETDGTLAAVLLLLYEKDNKPHIVLTRRTNHLANHSGEISLPGGAYEEDKDPSLLHTAVREAAEEVGIDPSAVSILGRLPAVHTMSSNYAIFPYVAASTVQPRFQPDPFEVAEVLEIPVAALRDPTAASEEDREVDGAVSRISYIAYGEHKIWGATWRILTKFFEILDKVSTHPACETESPREY